MTEKRGADNGNIRRRRWVIKVGSALLTHHDQGLNRSAIRRLVKQIADLKNAGVDAVLVSSGSIVEGIQRLGWRQRPHELYKLQAAAAVGQMGLIQTYETEFQKYSLRTAQVLLTNADLADRARYLNARSAIRTLIDLNVVPVINENDTVVTHEIRFGDNDTLAALVTNLIEAELLVLLTDQEGLFEQDPRITPGAKLIKEAIAGDRQLERMAGPGGLLGRGGMLTKLRAAEKAARSGAATRIASGESNEVLLRIMAGESVGTLLRAESGRLAARKQWLAGQLRVRGRLYLDSGAVQVLKKSGRSLLPVGVTRCEGAFSRGELVACLDETGHEVARGLVNYSAEESKKILGRSSREIESILGYIDEPELIHRDNIVVL